MVSALALIAKSDVLSSLLNRKNAIPAKIVDERKPVASNFETAVRQAWKLARYVRRSHLLRMKCRSTSREE